MSTEVEVKKENAVMTAQDWTGSQPALTANDIVIPRILLMQAMSELVTDQKASIGDFIDSLTKDKLGNQKTPVQFIPFFLKKNWCEYSLLADGKKKFSKIYPITSENEDLPYEDVVTNEKGEKQKVSRDRLMDFYVLLPSEIETGGLPYILSFRRTSLKAGKKLATQMYVKNVNAGKYPPSVICEVTNTTTKGDKGAYCTMDVRPVSNAEPKHIEKALYWMRMVTTGQVKEDNTSLDADNENTVDVQATNDSRF